MYLCDCIRFVTNISVVSKGSSVFLNGGKVTAIPVMWTHLTSFDFVNKANLCNKQQHQNQVCCILDMAEAT